MMALVAAGAAVTWLVSVGVGIAGGIAASFAPDWLTNGITTSIQDFHIARGNQSLVAHEEGLHSVIKYLQKTMRRNDPLSKRYPDQVISEIPPRMDLRRDTVTAILTNYYTLAVQVQKAKDDMVNAQYVIKHETELYDMDIWMDGKFVKLRDAFPDFAAPKIDYQLKKFEEADKAIEGAHAPLTEYAKQTLTLYAHEIHLFNHYLNDPNTILTVEVSQALDGELKWTCATMHALAGLFGIMDPKAIGELHLDQSRPTSRNGPITRSCANPRHNTLITSISTDSKNRSSWTVLESTGGP